MDKKNFSESFSGLGKVTGKKRWYTKIIQPGIGSTGIYPTEALKTSGPAAFPAGTKVNLDHQTEDESWTRPEGSVTTLAGAIVSEPVFEESGTEGPGLYAEIEFSDETAPFIEQFHPILGLSIHAAAYVKKYDEETDLPVVEAFAPSKFNTVDVVTVAGAGGQFISLVETYKEKTNEKNDKIDTNESQREEHGMTPEEIAALTKSVVAEVVAALTPEPNQEEAVEASEISEALIAAELPKSARDRVYKAVESGVALAEAVEAEKTYIKELTESLKKTQEQVEEAAQGVVGSDGKAEDYIVTGW